MSDDARPTLDAIHGRFVERAMKPGWKKEAYEAVKAALEPWQGDRSRIVAAIELAGYRIVPSTATPSGFMPEDFAHTAGLMRQYIDSGETKKFDAIMSNNHNIILAALDMAGAQWTCGHTAGSMCGECYARLAKIAADQNELIVEVKGLIDDLVAARDAIEQKLAEKKS